ncbi:hypothetical protein [Chitinophaga sp. Cy-1792]|uniref:hypothetical protein n=1 Tax=Chitinophaga sp. Cy-1792 TaxID=2608339 RepID=UPI00142291FD|nr:hypothetical protein [Chitinophaga sp. Cy-1792]NIG56494.1 hypothetical protein [Chitinophaga sp. Cy-1792]
MDNYSLSVFADYNQIFVNDRSKVELYFPVWSEMDYFAMLHNDANGVVISTLRNMEVEVFINVCAERPGMSNADWDQVVESYLFLPTGKLVVSGTTDFLQDSFQLDVPIGGYHMLVCFSGLNSISENGLDGNDQYHVFLWKGERLIENVIHKHRSA